DGDVPDPLGAGAQHHLLAGATPSALPSFGVETAAKQFRGFDSARIGRRNFVANGPAFSSVVVWVKIQPSFTSLVRADCPSILPTRPFNSARTTGTCVPSSSMYITGTGEPRIWGNSNCRAWFTLSEHRQQLFTPLVVILRGVATATRHSAGLRRRHGK